MVRRFLRGVLLTALAVGPVIGLATSVRADDTVASYGAGIEGADPMQTGCDQDAYTVEAEPAQEWVEFWDGAPELVTVGTVENRYSPICQANWARFTFQAPQLPSDAVWDPQGFDSVTVEISGGLNATSYTYDANMYDGQVIYTSMVYSPTEPIDPGSTQPADCAVAVVYLNHVPGQDFGTSDASGTLCH